MRGQYRIYPSWFSPPVTGALSGVTAPMSELAQRSAAAMGRRVMNVEIIRLGEDFRGNYIDFDVTYSSTMPVEKSS